MSGHEFSDVDRTGRADELVQQLDTIRSQEFLQIIERRMVERLKPRPGGHYLDVGCGTGDDVRGLAELVGPMGEVMGIDSSEAMIAEAEKRTGGRGLPVAFQQADAHHLPFADDTFDGCRTERVLQHVADPQQAVREMARVTRSAGRVVAFEPDWGAIALDAGDRAITRAVLNERCDSIRNGWIGRELARLFHWAGLIEVIIEPMTLIETDDARWMALFEMGDCAERLREAGVITPEGVEAWLAELAQAGREGTFFAAHTTFLVSARKP